MRVKPVLDWAVVRLLHGLAGAGRSFKPLFERFMTFDVASFAQPPEKACFFMHFGRIEMSNNKIRSCSRQNLIKPRLCLTELMMSETDYLVERRSLKKSRSRWRLAAFAVAAISVVCFGYWQFGRDAVVEHQAHIARLDVRGVIAGERTTLDLIKRVKDSKARAAVVVIDSPGGTVAGSDALYSALRDLSATMPVVAVVDGMAASGGYIAALASDHIIARRTSIVGSIGVLFQYPTVVKLLDTLGVKMEGVKSSPLKAAPNPVETTTPEARAALEAVVMDTFAWFKDIVRERRHLSDAELALVSDGRIFTGKQGLALKLVDALGDEKDAIAWLEKEKGLPQNLKVKRYRPKKNLEAFDLVNGAASVAHAMGFEVLASVLQRSNAENQGVVLDGLLVLWHPSSQ